MLRSFGEPAEKAWDEFLTAQRPKTLCSFLTTVPIILMTQEGKASAAGIGVGNALWRALITPLSQALYAAAIKNRKIVDRYLDRRATYTSLSQVGEIARVNFYIAFGYGLILGVAAHYFGALLSAMQLHEEAVEKADEYYGTPMTSIGILLYMLNVPFMYLFRAVDLKTYEKLGYFQASVTFAPSPLVFSKAIDGFSGMQGYGTAFCISAAINLLSSIVTLGWKVSTNALIEPKTADAAPQHAVPSLYYGDFELFSCISAKWGIFRDLFVSGKALAARTFTELLATFSPNFIVAHYFPIETIITITANIQIMDFFNGIANGWSKVITHAIPRDHFPVDKYESLKLKSIRLASIMAYCIAPLSFVFVPFEMWSESTSSFLWLPMIFAFAAEAHKQVRIGAILGHNEESLWPAFSNFISIMLIGLIGVLPCEAGWPAIILPFATIVANVAACILNDYKIRQLIKTSSHAELQLSQELHNPCDTSSTAAEIPTPICGRGFGGGAGVPAGGVGAEDGFDVDDDADIEPSNHRTSTQRSDASSVAIAVVDGSHPTDPLFAHYVELLSAEETDTTVQAPVAAHALSSPARQQTASHREETPPAPLVVSVSAPTPGMMPRPPSQIRRPGSGRGLRAPLLSVVAPAHNSTTPEASYRSASAPLDSGYSATTSPGEPPANFGPADS